MYGEMAMPCIGMVSILEDTRHRWSIDGIHGLNGSL
jgi:hypothetical protein